MRIASGVAVFLALECVAAQEPSTVPGVLVEKDVPFSWSDGLLHLDLYRPEKPGEVPFVVVLGGARDSAGGSLRGTEKGLALGAVFAAAGLAAAIPDYRERRAGWDLENAVKQLRRMADLSGLAPTRYGIHAVGEGVPAALDAAHERMIEAPTLSVAAGCGIVVEGLRSDVPLLVIHAPEDAGSTTAALGELAHQSVLAGAPVTVLDGDRASSARLAAEWHADRLSGARPDPATVATASRARDLARVASESGDAGRTVGLLRRAWDLGFERPEEVLLDRGFALHRVSEVSSFLFGKTKASEARTCARMEPGRRIRIRGRVVSTAGEPVAGVPLEFWQTDARGLYAPAGDDRQARLFAFARTDDRGRFVLATIRPGGYPATMIPAHVHVRLDLPAERGREAEILFDDDPRLTPDARRRAASLGWPIARLSGDERGVAEAEVDLPATRPEPR